MWNKLRIIPVQYGRLRHFPTNSHAPVFDGTLRNFISYLWYLFVQPRKFMWYPSGPESLRQRKDAHTWDVKMTTHRGNPLALQSQVNLGGQGGGGGDNSVCASLCDQWTNQRFHLQKDHQMQLLYSSWWGPEKLTILLRASSENHIFSKSLLILGKEIFLIGKCLTGLFKIMRSYMLAMGIYTHMV